MIISFNLNFGLSERLMMNINIKMIIQKRPKGWFKNY